MPMANRRGSGINLKNLDDLGPRLPTASRKAPNTTYFYISIDDSDFLL